MKLCKDSSGFTAVELLVTLFVAAAFLIAGYQLFSVVIRDGGQTRAEANASNVAYSYLRQYSASATKPCVASTPLNEEEITVDGLVSVTVTIVITCPNNHAQDLSKVKVTVAYNNPQQTIQYSTYTNGLSDPSEVMNGLIGWWRLNGNALDSSINENNGTATNVTSVVGQNGSTNGAYNFNGTNSYIRTSMNGFPASMNAITISLWANNTTTSNTSILIANPSISTDRLNIHLPWGNGNMYWDFGDSSGAGRVFTTYDIAWNGTWTHWLFTSDNPSGMKIYRNGTEIAASPSSSTFNTSSSVLDIGYYASGNTYWSGSIDDIRIYDRALSAAEAAALFNEGAL